MSNEVQVHEFSFFEFCLKTQELILKGYRFSDTNENFPQAFSGSYSCKMLKDISEDLNVIKKSIVEAVDSLPRETVVDAIIPESKSLQTKGRKPKQQ